MTITKILSDFIPNNSSSNYIIQGFDIPKQGESQCVGIDYDDGNRPIYRQYIKMIGPSAVNTKIEEVITAPGTLRKFWVGHDSYTLKTNGASEYITGTGATNSDRNSYINIMNRSGNDLTLYINTFDISRVNATNHVFVYYTLENEAGLGPAKTQLPRIPNIVAPGVEVLSGRYDCRDPNNIKPTYIQTVNLLKNPGAVNQYIVDLRNIIQNFEQVIQFSSLEKMCVAWDAGHFTDVTSYNGTDYYRYQWGGGATLADSRYYCLISTSTTNRTFQWRLTLEYTKTTDTPVSQI